MTKRIAVALIAVTGVMWGVSVRGAVTPQPGPEQKRLEYFVGKWRGETDFKATAATPASKASGSGDCEWFANLHVTCRGESTGPAGLYKSLRVAVRSRDRSSTPLDESPWTLPGSPQQHT